MSDAAVLDVEKVNVAEILEREESKAQGKRLLAAFEANPAAMKVLEAVETAEDAYEIVKKVFKLTLEQFKVLFDKTVDYFKGDKAALTDDTLEGVSGGWSLSQWWNENKKMIVTGACVVAGAVAGAVVGACAGGLEGAVIGACAGTIGGFVIGGGIAEAL